MQGKPRRTDSLTLIYTANVFLAKECSSEAILQWDSQVRSYSVIVRGQCPVGQELADVIQPSSGAGKLGKLRTRGQWPWGKWRRLENCADRQPWNPALPGALDCLNLQGLNRVICGNNWLLIQSAENVQTHLKTHKKHIIGLNYTTRKWVVVPRGARRTSAQCHSNTMLQILHKRLIPTQMVAG